MRGPLVEVILGPTPQDTQLIVDAGGTPKAFKHFLLVDTGAQSTCVEDSIAKALGLNPIRFTKLIGVSGQVEDRPVYRMSVTIGMKTDRGVVEPAVFTADIVGTNSPVTPQPFMGLLGRDFLQFVRLVYDGPKGEFELVDYRHVSAPPPNIRSGWKGIASAKKKAQKHKRRH